MPTRYVDGRRGLRFFFFTVALACIIGLALRLYLSPARIKSWVHEALGEKALQVGLNFQSANLRLARGSIPQLAIELTGVEANPAKDCRSEPSIRIARLRLPLSFSALLRGRIAIGTVSAEDLEVDLDGLKTGCSKPGASALKTKPASSSAIRVPSSQSTAPEPWWSKEQLSEIQNIIGGFDFSRVEVYFENKTKKVYLDAFSLEPGSASGTLHLETDLVIPPELTYGERIPPLTLDAIIDSGKAQVKVKAGLSEGSLLAKAILTSAPDQMLDAEITAAVDNVPLSTLVPLVTKSGIVQGTVRPRFLWMNCQASIRGRFQGLFTDNPLKLEGCEIQGKGAQIRAEHAIRNPDGSWEPFNVSLANVDLGQILETFDWQGPDGIFSDYGRLNGRLSVRASHNAQFDGDIKGAQIRFSNRNVRAEQRLTQMHAHFEITDGKIHGVLDHLDLEGGEFVGGLEISLGKHATQGRVSALISTLQLNEGVQKVLVGGRLDKISGRANGQIEGGKLVALTGDLKLNGVTGQEIRARESTIQTELARGGEFVLRLRAPEMEVHRDSSLFRALRGIFFEHGFSTEWVPIREPTIHARIGSAGIVRWDSARGELEGGQIKLSSTGAFERNQTLEGWVVVDFPKLKKLKWKVTGTASALVLSEDSPVIQELQRLKLNKNMLDDVALGLSNRAKPAKATAN